MAFVAINRNKIIESIPICQTNIIKCSIGVSSVL